MLEKDKFLDIEHPDDHLSPYFSTFSIDSISGLLLSFSN